MSGKSWSDLMRAVETFLSNPYVASSKVSIILYNTNSRIVVENETPNIQLIKRLENQGGWTDFNKALLDAYMLTQKYEDFAENFIWGFMTDGEAKYPTEAIKEIKSDSGLMSRIFVKIFGFGDTRPKGFFNYKLNPFASRLDEVLLRTMA